jgi:two-component system response regulator (stage 0 sporulation protein F)
MAKLLIVDDEIDVREFAANFFRRRKVEVSTASSGEEAIGVLEKQKPQMVLLDIKMDGIDGIETLKRIREKNKDVKVIMVTGREPDDAEAFNKCREYGAMDYIHKPLDLNELEKVVLATLEKIQ